jgi:hypothetical protein
MRYIYAAYLLALCQFAGATWIPRVERDVAPPPGTAKVTLFHNPSCKRDGESQYRRSLWKHNINSARNIESRDATVSSGPAVVNTGRYLFPIQIGSGGQVFQMELDTGSEDLWVFSSLLPPAEQGGHNIYDPSTSTSAIPLNKGWSIVYNDQSSASGIVYSDTISIEGIILNKQAVEAASDITGNLLQAPIDGILGLSLRPAQTSGEPSVLSNLLNHGLQSNLFTAKLTREQETNVEGFYTFGYIDEQLIGNQVISYAEIIPGGSWNFSSATARVGNEVLYRPPGNTAIADTGTALILVDDGLLAAIYEPLGGKKDSTLLSVSGNGAWVYPDTVTDAELPTITLAFGDFEVTLNPGDLNHGQAYPTGGWIYGGMQSRGNNNFDIFGDVWLNNVYAIFDLTQDVPRLGVVPRAYGT